MDLNKKQRLIGIFVLIAIAVIAIPSLFEFTYKKSSDHLSSNLPLEPQTPDVAIANTNEDEIDLTELDEFEGNSGQKAPVAKNEEPNEATPSNEGPAVEEINTIAPKTPEVPVKKAEISQNEELIIPKPHKVVAPETIAPKPTKVLASEPLTPKPNKVVASEPITPKTNKVLASEPIAAKPKKVLAETITPKLHKVEATKPALKTAKLQKAETKKSNLAHKEQPTSTKQKKIATVKHFTATVKHPIVAETPKKGMSKQKLATLKKPTIIIQQKSSVKKPETWTLQLGSFSNKENANKLISSLRKKGLAAYAKDLNNQEQTVTKVFIGPHTDKTKADHLVKQLADEFHIKAIVVRNQV